MNKIRLYKIIAILIAAIMMLPVFTIHPAAAKSMDLNKLISDIISNNSSIKLLDEKIEIQKRRCYTANAVSKTAETKYWISDTQHISNKKEELLYPVQAKNSLDSLVWQKQDKINSLTLEATKLYYQYLFKQKEIYAQLKSIELAKNELDIKKKQVMAGISINSTIEDYTVAITQETQKLNTLQSDYSILTMNINSLIERKMNEPLNLMAQDLKIEEYKVDDLEKVISSQIENNHSVIALKNQYQEAKIECDILYAYTMMEKPQGGEQLQDKITELSYSIKDEQKSIECKIRTDYNNLSILKNNIDVAKMSYESISKKYTIDKINYEQGQIPELSLLKTANDLKAASVSLSKAQLDYYISVQEFKNFIA